MTRLTSLFATLACGVAVMASGGRAARAVEPCQNPNFDPIGFRIEKKEHHSHPHGFRRLKLAKTFSRRLHFQVRFQQDIRYTTADPQNQADWGKLLGFTSNRIHKNSIRLGWAWNPTTNKVDLGYYGYLDSKRTMPLLTSVAPDEWADVAITFDDGGMSVEVNGVRHEERGSNGVSGPVSSWFLRTAYFGGDEKAPHMIHIDVRGIVVDEDCQR